MKNLFPVALLLLFSLPVTIFAQTHTLEGYVFEENNAGYVENAKVTILNNNTNRVVAELTTDEDGFFTYDLLKGQSFLVKVSHSEFFSNEKNIATVALPKGKKVFVKIELKRRPGYLFSGTIFEPKKAGSNKQDGIQDADIEIYNLTKKKEELRLLKNPTPFFSFTFRPGNHYVILIRKDHYYAKRLDAKIHTEGCIVCVDGVQHISSGTTTKSGFNRLNASIVLTPVQLNKPIVLENIFYDYNKWDIRKDAAIELDKLVKVMRENPSLAIELSSHTDSRGRDEYNMELSQKRADAAAQYLVKERGINPLRVIAKGYGETKLINKCKNGVKCSEKQHQENRRTEITVINYDFAKDRRTLAQIIETEQFEAGLDAVKVGEIVKVPKKKEDPGLGLGAAKFEEEDFGNVVMPKKEKLKEKTKVAVGKKEPKEKKYAPEKPKVTANDENESFDFEDDEITDDIVEEDATKDTATGNKINDRASSAKLLNEVQGEKKIKTEGRGKLVKVGKNFSGYAVEIWMTDNPLPPDHFILSQHGLIFFDQLSDDSYAYMLGNFNDKKRAEEFLSKIVIQRYPNAKVVHYREGKRI